MESDPSGAARNPTRTSTAFQERKESLQRRVNESAKALYEIGIRPTVARVRAALGGGSPNDLAPALKYWKDMVLPTLPLSRDADHSTTPALPLPIADLVYEMWQRAMAAAVVEVRGGPTAREVAARGAEVQGLRQQIADLRDRLQRESLAYGELRAQAARHETIARDALARSHLGESRERELLRELGGLRQRVAQLEATTVQRHAAGLVRAAKVKRRHAKKARGRRVKPSSVGGARSNRRVGRGVRSRLRGRKRPGRQR